MCDNRKGIMFTKIPFKTVALTAVMALGFGVLSIAPSLAAAGTHQADTLSATNTSISTSVGVPVTTILNQSFIAAGTEGLAVVASLSSGPNGSVALPVLTVAGGTDVNVSSHVISGGGLVSTTTATGAGYTTGYTTATLTPTYAGTYVVKFTPNIGTSLGTIQASTVTWTVNVSATPAVTAANSVVTLNASTGVVNTGVDSVVSASKSAAATPGSQVATIVVVSKNNLGTDLSSATTLTATIAGPGTLGVGGNTGTNNVAVGSIPMSGRAITGLVGQNLITVYADGTAGTGVVSIYSGSTLLATKSVTFSGAATTYATTKNLTNLLVGANGTNGSSSSNAIAVKVTDANGNIVSDGTLVYATSANALVATTIASQPTVAGFAYFAVQGIAAGSTNITFTDQPTGTTPTITTTVPVQVTLVVASAVTLTFDKPSYSTGEKMILTLNAKDVNGNGVADLGVYTNFLASAATSNVGLQGALPGVTPTFVNGSTSYTLYAPATAGTVNVFATLGSSANLALAIQGKALTATATVVADTSTTDALKAQIQALQDAATKAAADAATNAAAVATANAAAQAALTAQLTALQASNASALALINSLTKTINALNLKLNSKTIVCTKYHAANKTVKGLKPVCPTGYKLKK